MRKYHWLVVVFAAFIFAAACSSDSDNSTGGGDVDPWVGVWLSAGSDVAPILVTLFNYDSVRVTINADGTVKTESHVANGAWTTIEGTYAVTKSASGDVHSIELIYTSFEQAGIIEVTDGTPKTMRLEAVQTSPDIGAVPRTPESGFGSDPTLGDLNIQNYKEVQ
jgi:hypothetical protein